MQGFLVIFAAILSQGLLMMHDYWLRWWASNSLNASSDFYIIGLLLLTLATLPLGFGRAYLWLRYSLQCAGSIHDNVLWSVLHTDMGFFIAQPSGRILNRFAADLQQVQFQYTIVAL